MLGHHGTPAEPLDELAKLRAELAEVVHSRTDEDVRRAVLHRRGRFKPRAGSSCGIVGG